jgi:predicted nucleic acid-binding protein
MTARPIVIDASVGVGLIRGEPGDAQTRSVLEEAVSAGTRVVVPSLFWLEVMNPLMTRYRWAGVDVIRAIHDLDRLGVETIELDRPLLLSALDVAERHTLTAYDATYLAIAIVLDGRLLTFDEGLRFAAGGRAISTGGHRLAQPRANYERDVTWPNYKEASSYLAQLRAESIAGPRTS